MPLLFVMMALYCVIGFTGYGPVRQDEAYIFGIVLEYYRGHASWLIPQLAGRPFMEKPPLYYLLAALCTRAFSPWLSLPDAARLSSAFLVAASTLCIAWAGRLTWGRGYGRFAALALLCSAGLFVPSHMMLTDNAQLTGFALGLLGLAAYAGNRWWSGIVFGTGVGFAFLSKGLLGPGVLGLTALLLLLWPRWRTRGYIAMLAIATAAALPWLLIWPLELYRKSPVLFDQWLLRNNLDRFVGTAPAYLNAVKQTSFWYKQFLWGTFPVLPLAIVGVWRHRTALREQPALQIGLAFAVVMLVVLASSGTLRAIYALPLLLALALLAAPVLRAPPRWFRLSASASRYLFAGGALLIWSYWFAAVALKIDLLPRAPSLLLHHPHPLAVIAAIAVTALWGICLYAWSGQNWRRAAEWYGSIFGLLALFSLLCLPALAAKSSYRDVFEQLGRHLPRSGCVDSIGLGESQRGMLDYVLGLKTHMIADARHATCDTLLFDTLVRRPVPEPGPAWHKTWQGKRAPHNHEIFYLYQRNPGSS